MPPSSHLQDQGAIHLTWGAQVFIAYTVNIGKLMSIGSPAVGVELPKANGLGGWLGTAWALSAPTCGVVLEDGSDPPNWEMQLWILAALAANNVWDWLLELVIGDKPWLFEGRPRTSNKLKSPLTPSGLDPGFTLSLIHTPKNGHVPQELIRKSCFFPSARQVSLGLSRES
jgi:hypothetical protein